MERHQVLNLLNYLPPHLIRVANYNPTLNLYWMDIPVHLSEQDQDLYLCLIRDLRLRVFKVPPTYFLDGFRLKKRDQVIHLEIDADNFKDTKGAAKKEFQSFLYEDRDVV